MSDAMLNLLCEEIYKVAKTVRANNFLNDPEEENYLSELSLSAADIYEAVSSLKPRLILTASIANLVPRLDKRLEETRRPSDRFNLDLQAVNAAFDLLAPSGNAMQDDRLRAAWASKTVSLSTFVHQLKGLVKGQDLPESEKELLSSARAKSVRAEIVKAYLDHALKGSVLARTKDAVLKNLDYLWRGLDKVDFSASSQPFDNIVRHIKNLDVGKLFLDNVSLECVVCLETMAEPVVLPCNHAGCKSCLNKHLGNLGSGRFCPAANCTEELPENFSPKISAEMNRAVKQHSDFRHKMTQFFIELLQRFVFGQSSPPHQGIVEQLMEFVVTKKLPKGKMKLRTKPLSPFENDYFDSSPTIRSNLLQLLFRHDVSVELHLKKFISHKEPLVQEDRHFVELCVMIVHCLEDSFSSRSPSFDRRDQIRSALEHMESFRETEFLLDVVESLCKTARDRLFKKKRCAGAIGSIRHWY